MRLRPNSTAGSWLKRWRVSSASREATPPGELPAVFGAPSSWRQTSPSLPLKDLNSGIWLLDYHAVRGDQEGTQGHHYRPPSQPVGEGHAPVVAVLSRPQKGKKPLIFAPKGACPPRPEQESGRFAEIYGFREGHRNGGKRGDRRPLPS
jgi:hypothetical protein